MEESRQAFLDALVVRTREYVAEHGPLHVVRHTVQITSFGGTGSTALSGHLRAAGVDLPQTPGEAPFKHQRRPPAASDVPEGFRVIYPYGDPRDAMLSIFRRGWIVEHYRALREQVPPPEVERRLSSLEAFVDGGVDDFALADHVNRWLDHEPGYPVLFFRYESLETAWPTIREFVGLPADVPCLAVRARKSAWRLLPEPIRAGIDRIYGTLAATLEARPVQEIR